MLLQTKFQVMTCHPVTDCFLMRTRHDIGGMPHPTRCKTNMCEIIAQ